MLRTLGGLELEGSTHSGRMTKELMLLTYLVIEGGQRRMWVAELIWPTASDQRNSLSGALRRLRKHAPGSFEADTDRVWTHVPNDLQAFRDAVGAREHRRAVELYRGPFVAAENLSNIGIEFEEWALEQRESLAHTYREALLNLAEVAAKRGQFEEAGYHAASAYLEKSGPALDPSDLPRYYLFLRAAGHPLASQVQEEAAEFDIVLELGQDDAKKRLQPTFVGREGELARLQGLESGEWAWLHGAAGMGKTSLLRRLEGSFGSYLEGRAGTGKPYASLAPLLGSTIGEGIDRMLARLDRPDEPWMIDSWEATDEESRKLIVRLRDSRPTVKVIIASREPPPSWIDVSVRLDRLTAGALRAYPAAFEKTGGLPTLVAAFLRGDALEAALESRLELLPEGARRAYLALALLETSDVTAVRAALGYDSADMAEALETLIGSGLIDASYQVQARQAASELVEAHPTDLIDLALRLARQLEGTKAFPLYQRSRGLWEDKDLAEVRSAYLAWAQDLMDRGEPVKAAETLALAPPDDDTTLLHARALEKAGRYLEALRLLAGLPATPAVLAVQGTVLWRLGRHDEAFRTSQQVALDRTQKAPRAEALNTLGHLARSRGELQAAVDHTKRSAAIWKSLGRKAEYAGALNNLALTRALMGEDFEIAFAEALEAADNSLLKAPVILNLGFVFDQRFGIHGRQADFDEARSRFLEAGDLAERAGAPDTAAFAVMNIGVMHHKRGEHSQAREAYERALEIAQPSGEERILAMIMANLAELLEDAIAWDEAMQMLEQAGHVSEAEGFRSDLAPDHPFLKSSTPPNP